MHDLEQKRKVANKLSHLGKEILYIDFSKYNLIREKKAILSACDEALSIIKTYPANSLLLLTDFTGTRFDKDVAAATKNYSKEITPFVHASAIVGISGVQIVLVKSIQNSIDRNFLVADTIEEAKDWLVSQ